MVLGVVLAVVLGVVLVELRLLGGWPSWWWNAPSWAPPGAPRRPRRWRWTIPLRLEDVPCLFIVVVELAVLVALGGGFRVEFGIRGVHLALRGVLVVVSTCGPWPWW